MTKMTDTAATAAIGAATRELRLPVVRTDAERLAEIRAARARGMGGKNRQYAEMLEIYDELEEAAALHRRLGCPVIEVTGLSIEETAHRIVRLVDRRRQEAHAPT